MTLFTFTFFKYFLKEYVNITQYQELESVNREKNFLKSTLKQVLLWVIDKIEQDPSKGI